MKVQGLDRTLVDKVFAICDYYMQDRVKKHSRHIYDIYKLIDLVPQTKEFKALVEEVRNVRAMTNICPSAQPEVNVPDMLNFLIRNEIYKDDYENVTSRILEEKVSYEVAIEAVKKLPCQECLNDSHRRKKTILATWKRNWQITRLASLKLKSTS